MGELRWLQLLLLLCRSGCKGLSPRRRFIVAVPVVLQALRQIPRVGGGGDVCVFVCVLQGKKLQKFLVWLTLRWLPEKRINPHLQFKCSSWVFPCWCILLSRDRIGFLGLKCLWRGLVLCLCRYCDAFKGSFGCLFQGGFVSSPTHTVAAPHGHCVMWQGCEP